MPLHHSSNGGGIKILPATRLLAVKTVKDTVTDLSTKSSVQGFSPTTDNLHVLSQITVQTGSG